jgi:hypothetical protein
LIRVRGQPGLVPIWFVAAFGAAMCYELIFERENADDAAAA